MEDFVEKTKKKFIEWIKDPHNFILIAILSLALIIRMYFFILTNGQPLWWDESEYMLKANAIIKGTPLTGLALFREVFIPYIWAFFNLLGGEPAVRFVQVLVSTFTVFLTYLAGKELVNKRTGIIAALFISTFSIHLFFTNRIVTYIWTPMIYATVILFLMRGMKGNNKFLYLAAFILGLGIVAYFNTIFLVFGIFLYLILVERTNLFKKKKWWIFLLIFLLTLAPFFLYYYSTQGVPLPRFAQSQQESYRFLDGKNLGFFQWFGFIPQIFRVIGHPHYSYFPPIIFLIFGMFSLLEVMMGIDLIFKSKATELNKKLLLWIWLLVPLFMLTFILIILNSTDFYDAFLMPIFPALAIVSAIGFLYFYDLLKTYSKPLAKPLAVIILIFIIITNVSYANSMIVSKVSSYDSLKQAGLWIKENTSPGDTILTDALPEITYYSERATYPATPILGLKNPTSINETRIRETLDEFHPVFFLLSAYEAPAAWSIEYYQGNPNKYPPIIGFPSGQQPSTIIYSINYSAFEEQS